jgi:hypothetical protein
VSPLDLCVQSGLMAKIITERGVDLRERQVRMLQVNLFGAVTLSEIVEDNFNDLYIGHINPTPRRPYRLEYACWARLRSYSERKTPDL